MFSASLSRTFSRWGGITICDIWKRFTRNYLVFNKWFYFTYYWLVSCPPYHYIYVPPACFSFFLSFRRRAFINLSTSVQVHVCIYITKNIYQINFKNIFKKYMIIHHEGKHYSGKWITHTKKNKMWTCHLNTFTIDSFYQIRWSLVLCVCVCVCMCSVERCPIKYKQGTGLWNWHKKPLNASKSVRSDGNMRVCVFEIVCVSTWDVSTGVGIKEAWDRNCVLPSRSLTPSVSLLYSFTGSTRIFSLGSSAS